MRKFWFVVDPWRTVLMDTYAFDSSTALIKYQEQYDDKRELQELERIGFRIEQFELVPV
jgi:hypothetical protein